MLISCDKASIICNKVQYKEASWWQKIKLKLHLRYCGSCAEYTEKNTALTSLCDKAKLNSLSEADKEKMRKLFEGHQ